MNGTVTFPARLNRRHKAALFLTLVAAGAALVLGVGAKQTTGIVLLALAFTWAFGSNSRVAHWLFVALGSALLVTALWGFFQGWAHQVKEAQELGAPGAAGPFVSKDNAKLLALFCLPGLLLLSVGLGLIFGVGRQQNKADVSPGIRGEDVDPNHDKKPGAIIER